MTVREFAEKLGMVILAGEAECESRTIKGIYACDLLSWVMSHANKDDGWITVLTGINIAAVALMTEAACIIMPEGIEPDPQVLKKAEAEGLIILKSDLSTYQICCWAGSLLS